MFPVIVTDWLEDTAPSSAHSTPISLMGRDDCYCQEPAVEEDFRPSQMAAVGAARRTRAAKNLDLV